MAMVYSTDTLSNEHDCQVLCAIGVCLWRSFDFDSPIFGSVGVRRRWWRLRGGGCF